MCFFIQGWHYMRTHGKHWKQNIYIYINIYIYTLYIYIHGKNEKHMRHEEYMLKYTATRDDELPRTKNLPRPAWSSTNWRRGGRWLGWLGWPLKEDVFPLDSGGKVMGKSWEIHDFCCHFSPKQNQEPHFASTLVWRGWVLNGFKHIKH